MKRSIKEDYLSGAPELRSFYGNAFSEEGFGKQIKEKEKAWAKRGSEPRELLANQILKQNHGLDLSEKTRANIESIISPNTFTVTTGHQLVLMGGPMYMLYKIITVIRMAEELKKAYPEHNFVPIFWMASEDHDSEEANHFFSDFNTKRRYSGLFNGAVGHHTIEDSILDLFQEESEASVAKGFFSPGKKWADGFRDLIHQLFDRFGLVLVDGDAAQLKASFIPWMEKELCGDGVFDKIQTQSSDLESKGYKKQVNPRETNLFYLHPEKGSRLRIEVENESAHLVGDGAMFSQTFSMAEIIEELHNNPERFSPNVVLRPLYQEYLLPNLGYAGGWGELSYWLQLKTVFEYSGIAYPVLIPRMNASLFTAKQAQEWMSLGLELPDIQKENHLLFGEYVDRNWDLSPYDKKVSKIEAAFEEMAEYLETIDPTLAKSLLGQAKQNEKFAEKLAKKLKKSIRNKNPKPFKEIDELKDQIQPDGKVQERVLNWTCFSINSEELITRIYENCDPLKPLHQYITLG